MGLLLELLNLSILQALLSGAAGAYIMYILLRGNEDNNKFKNHFSEAVEHTSFASSYWDEGEIKKASSEMEKAAKSFLRASIYADHIKRNWCKVFANNLLNESSIINKTIIPKSVCLTALYGALQFEEPDFEMLNKARTAFEKPKFDTSVIAVNTLENLIRAIHEYETLEAIPEPEHAFLLQLLKTLYVLDGLLTRKIPIEKELFPAPPREPEVVYQYIGDTQKEWVRICLVQLDFSVQPLRPPEFGYVLKEKKETEKKVLDALRTASKNNVDIICFPELSFVEEWIRKEKSYDNIIICGTYYKNGFNICPVTINGTEYYIRKINPSPQFETEVVLGRKMNKGKKIFVFQTQCGKFAVLICMDYLREIHRILNNSDKKIRNVDLILVPEYNKDVARFQKKGDMDCLNEESHPYVIQVNALVGGVGGTCIIGAEHKDALERYALEGLKPEDSIEYKLAELEKERMLIVDLDIQRKGVPVPASGPKMKVVQKYAFEDGKWIAML